MRRFTSSLSLWLGCLCSGADWVAAESAGSKRDEIALPFYTEATLTPKWLSKDEIRAQGIHCVGDFQLTNQDGKPVSDQDHRGKIRVVAFFFTSCPGICSTMTKNMTTLQSAFRDKPRVRLVSYSVMPEVDSVTVLKDYAETYGIESGRWDLLTGNRQSIYRLARSSFFAEAEANGEAKDGGIIHSEKLLLVDGLGRIRGVYNGTLAFDMRRLIEDVEVLEKEL